MARVAFVTVLLKITRRTSRVFQAPVGGKYSICFALQTVKPDEKNNKLITLPVLGDRALIKMFRNMQKS